MVEAKNRRTAVIRTLIKVAVALPLSQTLAATIPIVDQPPIVHASNTLVSGEDVVETITADMLTERPSGGWANQTEDDRFTLSDRGAKMVLEHRSGGFVQNGYNSDRMDGAPFVLGQVATARAVPARTRTLYGINLSGGEFANQDNGALLPTPTDLDAYFAAGYRMFRIPMKYAQFTNGALPKLTALASECIKLATPCVFENHSYAWPSVADGIAQVVRADKLLPKSSDVQWGLANEPRGVSFDQWAKDAQAIIMGYRSAGATIRVWIDYPGSSGAQRFDKTKRLASGCDSAACALHNLPGGTLNDPLHLTGIDIHRYFDSNGSGTSVTCAAYVMIASAASEVVPFDLPVMIGEYAFGNDLKISPTCAALAPQIMSEIKASPNLYGVALWGGGAKFGAVWKGYMFRAAPVATSAYIRMTAGR
jgi:hypothetical protein